jgi:hypothetical protein
MVTSFQIQSMKMFNTSYAVILMLHMLMTLCLRTTLDFQGINHYLLVVTIMSCLQLYGLHLYTLLMYDCLNGVHSEVGNVLLSHVLLCCSDFISFIARQSK